MKIGKQVTFDNSSRGKIRFLSLLFVFIIFAGIFLYKNIPINLSCIFFTEKQNIFRVAHAGGGIDGETYTNSIQAMDLNYSKGFRFFEIDFNTTSDATIVCVHDWARFRTLANKDDLDVALSFAEFEALNGRHFTHKRCTLETLAEWFGEHQDTFLITDVKDNNLESLEVILNQIPNSDTVVIPQIYTPDEYDWVVSAGVKKIIWTLYRSPLTEFQILNKLENMQRVIALTMPVAMAESTFPVQVLRQGFGVYAHTVNDAEEYRRLTQNNCISEIYTDFLEPTN